MKYFVILIASFLFFIGSTLIAYFLWHIEQNWIWKGLMIYCSAFTGYIFIRSLLVYSKIHLNNGELRVSKLFSLQTYDLNDLISWTEETNPYRAGYRKMNLTFPNKRLTLLDYPDRANFEQLFHHLRIHYKSNMILP